MKVDYITEYLAENTIYKSVYNEWNSDRFSIVVLDDKVWYTESRGVNDRTWRIIYREMKRLFPNLTWIYDLKKGGANNGL